MTDDLDLSEEWLARSRRFVMKWDDFSASATTLPDYEVKTRNLIFLRLGYLPPTAMVYMPYEPYLRTLFAHYEEGKLAGDIFLDEVDQTVRHIRNDDLKKHGFAGDGDFTQEDYEYYDSFLSKHREAARSRLSCILDYEPLLKHSLSAEIHMRQLMQEDHYHAGLLLDKVDHRSFTIYHYTHERIEHGKAAADTSPLMRIGERPDNSD